MSFLYLPARSGNYASTPDAALLDITGDITLVGKVALNDWTPIGTQAIVGKYNGSGNQRSYLLYFPGAGAGEPRLVISELGTDASNVPMTATVAPTVSAGNTLWLAAALDVDNGVLDADCEFWTSLDGRIWVQLGTTVNPGATLSAYSGSAGVEAGSFAAGTGGNLDGNVYRAQVYNGAGFDANGPSGTLVFDADFEKQLPGIVEFAEDANGATVTVNADDEEPHAKIVGRQVAGGFAFPLAGPLTGWATTPDSPAVSVTGDISIATNWRRIQRKAQGNARALVQKYGGGGNRSFSFNIPSNNLAALGFMMSDNGSNLYAASNRAVPNWPHEMPRWVGVSRRQSDGLLRFYYSAAPWNADPATFTWFQAGTDQVLRAGDAIHDGNTDLLLAGGISVMYGGRQTGIWNRTWMASGFGMTGATPVVDADFVKQPLGTTEFAEDVNGATVTIAGAAKIIGRRPTNGLHLPGRSSNSASAPDPWGAVTDFELVARIHSLDYDPSLSQTILAQWAGVNSSFIWRIETSTGGKIRLMIDNGAGTTSYDVAPGFVDDTTYWLKSEFVSNNGGGNSEMTLYTSSDDTGDESEVSWTVAGSKTQAVGLTMASSASDLEIGARGGGTTQPFDGTIHRAIVRGTVGGVPVFDANFDAQPTGTTSFAESAAGATVTVNQSVEEPMAKIVGRLS